MVVKFKKKEMSSHNKSFMEQLDDDAEMSLSKEERMRRKYRQDVANMLGSRAMLISERQSETPLDEQIHLFMNEEGYYGVDLDALISKYEPSERFTDGSPKYSFQQVFNMLNEIHYGEPMTDFPPKMEMGGTTNNNKNMEVILTENRPNGAVWQGVVLPFMMKSIEENQYRGGFKRYEIDIYDDVDRNPTKEELKGANEFFDKVGGRYFAEGGEVGKYRYSIYYYDEEYAITNGADGDKSFVRDFTSDEPNLDQIYWDSNPDLQREKLGYVLNDGYYIEKDNNSGQRYNFGFGSGSFADGGRVSRNYMTSKVPLSEYPSLFGDNDGDGIPNVDDVAPMNPKINEQVEEVRLSDEMKTIIEYRNEFDEVREDMVDTLEDIVDVCGAKGKCGIMSRTKTPYSIINKLRRRSLTDVPNLDKLEKKAKQKLANNDLSGIDLYKGLTDVVGTMVVTPDKESSDKIKNEILSGRVGKVLEFEDMYEDSKAGYRAYHFLVGVEKDGSTFPIEIQVKTQRIKELSDLAHTLYKQGKINPKAFEKLMDLANKGDKGSVKAQKEFSKLMSDKANVKRMISKNSKFAEGGNVFSMYDNPIVTTEEQSNRQIIEPYIPKHIYVDAQEEKLINLPLLANAIETTPEFMSTRNTSDEFMNKAYLHYSNDVAHFFVTEIDKANGLLYGYQIIGDDDDAKWGQLDRSILDQDYNDELVNWKLDYEFHPQFVNEALKRFGKRNLMSRDVPLTSAFGEDVDIDRIVNTKYTTDNDRNRAIINLMGYLGDDINEYPLEAQNFISNYACGLFRDIITTKLYKTLVGMLYLNAENNDASIDRVICINSCIGNLINFFDKEVNVTCVDTDKNAVQIGSVINSRENSQNITREDLQLNPPSERVNGMIILSDSLDMAITDMSYLLPNGVAVVMCYVDDFETYFATESVQKRFLQGFLMTEKYRVSSDTILLQLKKK